MSHKEHILAVSRPLQRESNSAGSEPVEPVVARLGTMLEFLFADPYFIPAFGVGPPRPCPPITVIGPITARRVQLVMRGHIQRSEFCFGHSACIDCCGDLSRFLLKMGLRGILFSGLLCLSCTNSSGTDPAY